MQELAALAGIIAFVIGAPFGIRKIWHLFRPIRLVPSIKMVFGAGPDGIGAKITNLSNEALYIVRCVARPTWSLKYIIFRHLRHPLVRPRMYGTLRYAAQTFPFLKDGPLKLEGKQQMELTHLRSSHLLAAFMAPMLRIEVELSSGRVFRSRRLPVPNSWLMINHPQFRVGVQRAQAGDA